jgi:hypothetical protein
MVRYEESLPGQYVHIGKKQQLEYNWQQDNIAHRSIWQTPPNALPNEPMHILAPLFPMLSFCRP